MARDGHRHSSIGERLDSLKLAGISVLAASSAASIRFARHSGGSNPIRAQSRFAIMAMVLPSTDPKKGSP